MTVTTASDAGADLRRRLRDHLLLNFTDMGSLADQPVPVFARGEGCHVVDVEGRRFIDGLSGLFCTNLGHGYGAEIGQAAQRQLAELVFTPTWYLAHPAAIEMAERVAHHAPAGMDHVFFTTGGGEAVEAAWKLARQWHALNGQPQRRKAISRRTAYHGTSLGALSFTGYREAREPFEPLAVPTRHVSATNAYRHPQGADEAVFTAALLAEIEDVVDFEGPDTIGMLIAEPVQNSGGAFTPPEGYWAGLREICDRHGILLVADEVITGFGRTGHWFASDRYGIRPDLITFAKGATAAHAPLGGVVLSERVAEPFVSGRATFMHGTTWGGHPLSTAVGVAALDVYERLDVMAHVRATEPAVASMLAGLRANPLVGDVRGAGFFWAVELVKDQATRESFDDDEARWLLRDVLSRRLFERGLLCRLDDRADPVVQLSPPLVSDLPLWASIVAILRETLDEAAALVDRGRDG